MRPRSRTFMQITILKEGNTMQRKDTRYGQFLRAKRIADSRKLTLKDIAQLA